VNIQKGNLVICLDEKNPSIYLQIGVIRDILKDGVAEYVLIAFCLYNNYLTKSIMQTYDYAIEDFKEKFKLIEIKDIIEEPF
jgi:hypothetical protein